MYAITIGHQIIYATYTRKNAKPTLTKQLNATIYNFVFEIGEYMKIITMQQIYIV